jgi:metal-responsive CopG/Arc/MetJ family transcriptional regulator
MPDEEPRSVRVQLLLTQSEAQVIDEWGFKRRMRFRNEVIRELIRRGLRHSDTEDTKSEVPSR